MAVDEQRGSWGKAGGHESGLPGIELNEDETLPAGPVGFGIRVQLVQEGLLELEDFLYMHADDEGLGGGGRGIGEDDVFEVVGAGRQDRGALIDLGGIEQVKDGKMLDLKDFVHAFEAEAAFAVEEIGDVGLLESGLLGQAEAGEFSCCDAVPEDFAEIILQEFELHGRSIAPGYRRALSGEMRSVTGESGLVGRAGGGIRNNKSLV